jgi:hypothetical protein
VSFYFLVHSRTADSSSTNAVSFSSARTTKRRLSLRCASAIQTVRPVESIAETQPQLQPALLIVVDQLRSRFARLELSAHLLQARAVAYLFLVRSYGPSSRQVMGSTGRFVVHSISICRQADCFMLLIVPLSSGLTRNPHPLSPTRKSITHGSGSVW